MIEKWSNFRVKYKFRNRLVCEKKEADFLGPSFFKVFEIRAITLHLTKNSTIFPYAWRNEQGKIANIFSCIKITTLLEIVLFINSWKYICEIHIFHLATYMEIVDLSGYIPGFFIIVLLSGGNSNLVSKFLFTKCFKYYTIIEEFFIEYLTF